MSRAAERATALGKVIDQGLLSGDPAGAFTKLAEIAHLAMVSIPEATAIWDYLSPDELSYWFKQAAVVGRADVCAAMLSANVCREMSLSGYSPRSYHTILTRAIADAGTDADSLCTLFAAGKARAVFKPVAQAVFEDAGTVAWQQRDFSALMRLGELAFTTGQQADFKLPLPWHVWPFIHDKASVIAVVVGGPDAVLTTAAGFADSEGTNQLMPPTKLLSKLIWHKFETGLKHVGPAHEAIATLFEGLMLMASAQTPFVRNAGRQALLDLHSHYERNKFSYGRIDKSIQLRIRNTRPAALKSFQVANTGNVAQLTL